MIKSWLKLNQKVISVMKIVEKSDTFTYAGRETRFIMKLTETHNRETGIQNIQQHKKLFM